MDKKDVSGRYEAALNEIAWSGVSRIHPGYTPRIIDKIYAKNEELNRVRRHPEGRTKQDWLSLVDKIKGELSDLIAQDDKIVVDNAQIDITYQTDMTKDAEKRKQTPETQLEAVRAVRNALLNESDWTQCKDAPISAKKDDAWVLYRNKLRDLTANCKSASEIKWPEPPE